VPVRSVIRPLEVENPDGTGSSFEVTVGGKERKARVLCIEQRDTRIGERDHAIA
jgi:hypothetical protein